MRQLKTFTLFFIGCLLIFSCKKEAEQQTDKDVIPASLIDKIKAAGFSTNGIVKVKDGYIVEGDIFLSEKILAGHCSQGSCGTNRAIQNP
ncbi:hypothetical protein ECE50_009325 [Chitinophaga sp. Mgbs1]|uniref:Uncharacterized protein n=1 Tax=Chitinophaga solisilvae TaxID=1233460 RepID=A0A9Q5DAZ9_9BACT|nr:hypothetical protein [Chitinophaga solisilvae]